MAAYEALEGGALPIAFEPIWMEDESRPSLPFRLNILHTVAPTPCAAPRALFTRIHDRFWPLRLTAPSSAAIERRFGPGADVADGGGILVADAMAGPFWEWLGPRSKIEEHIAQSQRWWAARRAATAAALQSTLAAGRPRLPSQSAAAAAAPPPAARPAAGAASAAGVPRPGGRGAGERSAAKEAGGAGAAAEGGRHYTFNDKQSQVAGAWDFRW
jgi:hypothetical protein